MKRALPALALAAAFAIPAHSAFGVAYDIAGPLPADTPIGSRAIETPAKSVTIDVREPEPATIPLLALALIVIGVVTGRAQSTR